MLSAQPLLDFWTWTPANRISDLAFFAFSFWTWPQNANECKQRRRGGLEGTFLRQHTIPGLEGGVRTVKVSHFRSVPRVFVSGVSDHLRPPATLAIRSFHVSRPMRVSFADRKECRTKTTGFGPEWRSNTWRRKASRRLCHTSDLVSGLCVRWRRSLRRNCWTHHFSLRTPEVKVKVAYAVVGGHFELLVGVSVQHGAPRELRRLPRHSEALLIVQRQSDVLPVQRAPWETKREKGPLKTGLGGSKGVKKQVESGGRSSVCSLNVNTS